MADQPLFATPRPLMEKESGDSASRLRRWRGSGSRMSLQVGDFLKRQRHLVLGAVIGAAVLLRVVVGYGFYHSPFWAMDRWPECDMHTYRQVAKEIVGGDYACRYLKPPFHQWHQDIADDYSARFPEEWSRLLQEAEREDVDPRRLLWERWCETGRLYHDLLYSYALAVVEALPGDGRSMVFIIQAVMGIGTLVLLHDVTSRLFGDIAAAFAACFAVFYGPMVFYEFVLLRATAIVFLGILVVRETVVLRTQPGSIRWCILGLLLGVAICLKSHFVLMVPVVAWQAGLSHRPQRRLQLRAVGLVACGLLLGISPIFVRNSLAGCSLFSAPSSGVPTFVIANSTGATAYGWGLEKAAWVLGSTNAQMPAAAVHALETHASIWSYLALVANKALAVTCWYEAPNNVNFYFACAENTAMAFLPVTYPVILCLAVVGLCNLNVWNFGKQGLATLFGLAAVNLLVCLLVFPIGRFRLVWATALLPFAGYGAAQMCDLLWAKKWRSFGLAVITIMATAGILTQPWAPRLELVRALDLEAAWEVYYRRRVEAAVSREAFAEAATIVGSFADREQAFWTASMSESPTKPGADTALAVFFARMHAFAAMAYVESGDEANASRHKERSLVLLRRIE